MNGECLSFCVFNTDCPDGFACNDEYCVPPEEACENKNCPDGTLCVLGECYPYTPLNTGIAEITGNLSSLDPDGGRVLEGVLESVELFLFDPSDNIVYLENSDENGNFSFQNVLPGTYRLQVLYPPYVMEEELIEVPENSQTIQISVVLNMGIFEIDVNNVILGIENQLLSSQLTIYPNPADDFVVIKNESGLKDLTFMITDFTGRSLVQDHFKITGTISKINLKGFGNGILLIGIFKDKTLIKVEKVILQRE